MKTNPVNKNDINKYFQRVVNVAFNCVEISKKTIKIKLFTHKHNLEGII